MKLNQLPHTLLMVKPASFGFNPQTAASNAFQEKESESVQEIQRKALAEFNRMTEQLESYDIEVRIFEDEGSGKPDAIFPNNWISFHEGGEVILYPMMAENRRKERRTDIVDALAKDFKIKEIIDLSNAEQAGKYLEGTGSIVFDHVNQKLYACLSPRTDRDLVANVAKRLGYKSLVFNAVDENEKPIYHTNVILSIGRKFVLVCLDAIQNEKDQDVLLDSFSESDLKVIAISYAQMRDFAGNVLEVQTRHGDPVVVLSETAFQSLLPGQTNVIGDFAEILPININTIEKHGGGSVRCMIAGIHLPRRNSI